MRQKVLKNSGQLISTSPLPAPPARGRRGRDGPRRSPMGPSVAPVIGRRWLRALLLLGFSGSAIPLPCRDQSGPIPVMIMDIRLPSSDKGSSMIS
jgi:hypothetical protein